MSELYNEHQVYSATPRRASDVLITDDPRRVFSLELVPEEVDPDQLFGAQLTCETFRPTSTPQRGALGNETYHGWIGDPDARQEAMLTIDTLAQRRNRRARADGAALIRGVNHDPEGSLIVFSANDH